MVVTPFKILTDLALSVEEGFRSKIVTKSVEVRTLSPENMERFEMPFKNM